MSCTVGLVPLNNHSPPKSELGGKSGVFGRGAVSCSKKPTKRKGRYSPCYFELTLLSPDTKMTMTDVDFTAILTAHLAQFSEGHQPIVPLFKNSDGSIDRDKTLALPCYMDLARA